MSIFNPWGEVRTLKAALAAHKAAQKAVEQEMQAQLDELQRKNFNLRIENDSLHRDIKDVTNKQTAYAAKLEREIVELKKELAECVRRDPETGRYLKRGK